MLTLTGIRKRFRDVVALDGLSMQATPGRLVGFLGPNGAGKTTAMRSIFGLIHIDEGQVRWNQQPVDSATRLRFGYMPEQRGLYPRMPIGRQLAFIARMHGLERSAATMAAKAWLDRFNLAQRHDDPLSALSHGNQQRVQLAAALVHDPELLVLDEPFSGLDPLGVQAMSMILREQASRGACVVFSSHQLELVEELCDDVVIIANGRDRLSGTLDEARSAAAYRNIEVRLASGRPVSAPVGIDVTVSHDGTSRLRVPVDTDVRSVVAQLPSDATIEHLSFSAPRLTEVFSDVVGLTIEELEATDDADSEAN